jgi:hypothetical protein
MELQRRLPKEDAAELKGSRWLWVNNSGTLSLHDQKDPKRLQQHLPELRRANRTISSFRAGPIVRLPEDG